MAGHQHHQRQETRTGCSHADPRAYTDRLNALFSPQGWTREHKIETLSNITRVKKGESILSGKMLVSCTVTILGLGSHSGTGEEWADDDNGITSADAQAFKRACSCFGLGRYFYDFPAIWVDLAQKGQPVKSPVLSSWALPENWRKGLRPPGRNGEAKPEEQGKGSKSDNSGGSLRAFLRHRKAAPAELCGLAESVCTNDLAGKIAHHQPQRMALNPHIECCGAEADGVRVLNCLHIDGLVARP